MGEGKVSPAMRLFFTWLFGGVTLMMMVGCFVLDQNDLRFLWLTINVPACILFVRYAI